MIGLVDTTKDHARLEECLRRAEVANGVFRKNLKAVHDRELAKEENEESENTSLQKQMEETRNKFASFGKRE